MMQIKVVILFLFLLSVNAQAQSKKELQNKYDELLKTNLTLEKSNSVLNTKVKNLTERVNRLEKELLEAKKAEKEAVAKKEEATKAKETAMQAQIETMKAKEALIVEKKRMEVIFNKAAKGKTNLQQMSIVGRYNLEKSKDDGKDYISLFEDGTLLMVTPPTKGEKDPLLNSISGKYKLKGNRITLIVSIFTMTHVIEGTLEGTRLTIQNKGKKEVYFREK